MERDEHTQWVMRNLSAREAARFAGIPYVQPPPPRPPRALSSSSSPPEWGTDVVLVATFPSGRRVAAPSVAELARRTGMTAKTLRRALCYRIRLHRSGAVVQWIPLPTPPPLPLPIPGPVPARSACG